MDRIKRIEKGKKEVRRKNWKKKLEEKVGRKSWKKKLEEKVGRKSWKKNFNIGFYFCSTHFTSIF
ncbi:hypothetical protein [Methanosarcina sp. MTP4]|uniref:hypothetical protein n=1 Tax=Methanosarcina sp. MTP4 TaxID=1434100 RepID=UPI000ABDCFBA|nr:hypothetical protein [Methanosarcina sp. MTP4]